MRGLARRVWSSLFLRRSLRAAPRTGSAPRRTPGSSIVHTAHRLGAGWHTHKPAPQPAGAGITLGRLERTWRLLSSRPLACDFPDQARDELALGFLGRFQLCQPSLATLHQFYDLGPITGGVGDELAAAVLAGDGFLPARRIDQRLDLTADEIGDYVGGKRVQLPAFLRAEADPRTLIAATAAASSLRMSPSRPRVSARSHALANGLRDGRRPASTSKAYQPARRGP